MHEEVPNLHKVDPHVVVKGLNMSLCTSNKKSGSQACEVKARVDYRELLKIRYYVLLVKKKTLWARIGRLTLCGNAGGIQGRTENAFT